MDPQDSPSAPIPPAHTESGQQTFAGLPAGGQGCDALAPPPPALSPPPYQDLEHSNSFSCPIPSAHSNLLPRFLAQRSAASCSSCLLAFLGYESLASVHALVCLGRMLSWPTWARGCLYQVHTAVTA